MEGTLDFIDRFFQILINPEHKNNERFYSEWSYLLTLLKSEPISHDRIEAYLNILQTHDSAVASQISKGRKSQTEHPKAKVFLAAASSALELLERGSEQMKHYDMI